MRVFAVSDIHTDYPQNLAWAQQWCSGGGFKQDAVLLAGDVSDSMETLTKTLETFAAAFGHVFFVPGNHGAGCSGALKAPLFCCVPVPWCPGAAARPTQASAACLPVMSSACNSDCAWLFLAADLWVRRQERDKYDSLGAPALCSAFPWPTPCLPVLLPALPPAAGAACTWLLPPPFSLTAANRRRVAEKLKVVQQLCRRLGIHTEPACVGGVWIVPLLSW